MTKCSNYFLTLLLSFKIELLGKMNWWLWSFTLLLKFKSVYKAAMYKIIWTIEILTNEHEINRQDLIHMMENLIFKYVLLWLVDMSK